MRHGAIRCMMAGSGARRGAGAIQPTIRPMCHASIPEVVHWEGEL